MSNKKAARKLEIAIEKIIAAQGMINWHPRLQNAAREIRTVIDELNK